MTARDWPGRLEAANRLAIRLKTHLEGDFPGRDPRSEPRITSLHHDYLPPLLWSELDLFLLRAI